MSKLYPEQEEVAQEAEVLLRNYGMVYIAAEPRFGKSYITASLITTNSLILTVKSALAGWEETCRYFDIEPVLINYESLHKVDYEKFDYIVIDEAPKISSFPKKNKARKEIDRFIHKDIKVVFLSGTPNIESQAQLFHQLSISPNHSFSKYYEKGNSTAFSHWYFGGDNFVSRDDNLKGYGNRTKKIVGYNKEAWNHADVSVPKSKYEPIMIKRFHTDENMSSKVVLRPIKAPKSVEEVYHTLKTNKCFMGLNGVGEIEPIGKAQLLIKLHQIAQGNYISTDGTTVHISSFKARVCFEEHPDAIVFYKYQADLSLLRIAGYTAEQLKQVDSSIMGIDFSNYEEAIIYSLTWSGQNYVQCLSRLNNVNKNIKPTFYVYITKGTVDEKIFKAVSNKRDFNTQFIRS